MRSGGWWEKSCLILWEPSISYLFVIYAGQAAWEDQWTNSQAGGSRSAKGLSSEKVAAGSHQWPTGAGKWIHPPVTGTQERTPRAPTTLRDSWRFTLEEINLWLTLQEITEDALWWHFLLASRYLANSHQPCSRNNCSPFNSINTPRSFPDSWWDRLEHGTWDPLLQCLHLDKRLFKQQIQRNHKGLKITACMYSWSKVWTIRYSKTKTQWPFPRLWEQKQGVIHDPCTQHHQGGRQVT